MPPSQIRALRNKLKLSPTDFGVALGFAENSARITVWRLETGKRKPSGPTLMLIKKLARTLAMREGLMAH